MLDLDVICIAQYVIASLSFNLLRHSSLVTSTHSFMHDEVEIPHDFAVVVPVLFGIFSEKVVRLCTTVLCIFCGACSCYCD